MVDVLYKANDSFYRVTDVFGRARYGEVGGGVISNAGLGCYLIAFFALCILEDRVWDQEARYGSANR